MAFRKDSPSATVFARLLIRFLPLMGPLAQEKNKSHIWSKFPYLLIRVLYAQLQQVERVQYCKDPLAEANLSGRSLEHFL